MSQILLLDWTWNITKNLHPATSRISFTQSSPFLLKSILLIVLLGKSALVSLTWEWHKNKCLNLNIKKRTRSPDRLSHQVDTSFNTTNKGKGIYGGNQKKQDETMYDLLYIDIQKRRSFISIMHIAWYQIVLFTFWWRNHNWLQQRFKHFMSGTH